MKQKEWKYLMKNCSEYVISCKLDKTKEETTSILILRVKFFIFDENKDKFQALEEGVDREWRRRSNVKKISQSPNSKSVFVK